MENDSVEIYYFTEDKFRGYQRENRSFFVEVSEIVQIISEPVVKQISIRHHTMMFKGLHE